MTEIETKLKYELSLVSYLDILGMHELLEKAKYDPNPVADVLNKFREFSKPDEGSQDIWGWQSINFSDLFVRSVPVFSEVNKKHRIGLLFHEIQDLCDLQVNLLARGILIRGSLTYGRIHIANGLIFGSALAQAHNLESQKAKFPRIILDPRLLDLMHGMPLLRQHTFTEEMEYLEPVLSTDSDGQIFIDYLGYIGSETKPKEHVKYLATHRGMILEKRRALSGDRRSREYKSRRSKIKWLVDYHAKHLSRLDENVMFDQTGTKLKDLELPWWA